jgi:hypothetical protein
MPNWQELTRRVVNTANGLSLSDAAFGELLRTSGWNLDAWIQEALNRHLSDGKSLEEFAEKLRELLYQDILDAAQKDGVRAEIATALNNPQRITKRKFDSVAAFLHAKFSDTTVYKLADILTDVDINVLPSAVLNFNADTFFEAISAILRKKKTLTATGKWEDPPQIYSRIVRSSDGVSTRVPIYHLHGCLQPVSPDKDKWSETPGAVVLPENSYTSIAGRMFTWAQSVFLYHAQAGNLCFVGLSMTDTNIRRWLSWTFEGYQTDLRAGASPKELSGRHLWLAAKPALRTKDPRTKLYPYAMRHLGVQVCWLSSWSQCDRVFKRLLGLR